MDVMFKQISNDMVTDKAIMINCYGVIPLTCGLFWGKYLHLSK